MARFYIKISGSALIEADTADTAIKSIKSIASVFCIMTALEIGKDVDELGYPIIPLTRIKK